MKYLRNWWHRLRPKAWLGEQAARMLPSRWKEASHFATHQRRSGVGKTQAALYLELPHYIALKIRNSSVRITHLKIVCSKVVPWVCKLVRETLQRRVECRRRNPGKCRWRSFWNQNIQNKSNGRSDIWKNRIVRFSNEKNDRLYDWLPFKIWT